MYIKNLIDKINIYTITNILRSNTKGDNRTKKLV
jgi:hypothetical protein